MGKISWMTIFCVVFAVLIAFSPYRRIQLEWSTLPHLQAIKEIYQIHTYIAFLILPVIISATLQKYWNKVMSYRRIIVAGIIGMMACLVLTFVKIPGWWWTWGTLGLYIMVLVWVVYLLKDKLPAGEALITGIAVVCLSVGCWEIPYQIGLKYVYDLPQIGIALVPKWVASEIAVETPLIIGGALILYLQNTKYHFLYFSKTTLIFMACAIGYYLAWFATGFWVDVYYDWSTTTWVQTAPNSASMLIYRLSKSFTALAFASLIIPRRSYERIPINPPVARG